jgi:hypothetical protein
MRNSGKPLRYVRRRRRVAKPAQGISVNGAEYSFRVYEDAIAVKHYQPTGAMQKSKAYRGSLMETAFQSPRVALRVF